MCWRSVWRCNHQVQDGRVFKDSQSSYVCTFYTENTIYIVIFRCFFSGTEKRTGCLISPNRCVVFGADTGIREGNTLISIYQYMYTVCAVIPQVWFSSTCNKDIRWRKVTSQIYIKLLLSKITRGHWNCKHHCRKWSQVSFSATYRPIPIYLWQAITG